jgi:hypothetical protein
MPLALLALAGTAVACSSGPQVTAQQKRAVSGVLGAPTTTSTPTTTPTSNAVGPGTSPSANSAGSSPTPGAPPNVVGQSLPIAENRLGAAGFSASARPWGGSCSTLNQVMQQVPPQGGTVQLFYCPKVT